MSVEAGKASPDGTQKVQECLFVNLVLSKQFGVVAKVAIGSTDVT